MTRVEARVSVLAESFENGNISAVISELDGLKGSLAALTAVKMERYWVSNGAHQTADSFIRVLRNKWAE